MSAIFFSQEKCKIMKKWQQNKTHFCFQAISVLTSLLFLALEKSSSK